MTVNEFVGAHCKNDVLRRLLYLRTERQPSGCLLWTGGVYRSTGYGRITYKQVTIQTHRLSWALEYGPIPDIDENGQQVCILHVCDVGLCIEPLHLFKGSRKHNTEDMMAKGRNRYFSGRGESCSNAKLSEADVLLARTRYFAGGVTQKRLATELGVSGSCINFVISRRSWSYLPAVDREIVRDNRVVKLSVSDVLFARREYRNGRTQTDIAKELGVAACTVSQTVRGKKWRNVPPETESQAAAQA